MARGTIEKEARSETISYRVIPKLYEKAHKVMSALSYANIGDYAREALEMRLQKDLETIKDTDEHPQL